MVNGNRIRRSVHGKYRFFAVIQNIFQKFFPDSLSVISCFHKEAADMIFRIIGNDHAFQLSLLIRPKNKSV